MNKHSKATHLCRKGIGSIPKNTRLTQLMAKPVSKRKHERKAGKTMSPDEYLRQMKKLHDQRARQFNRRLKRDQKAAEYRAAESAKIKASLKAQAGA